MPKLPTYTAQLSGGLPTFGGRRAEASDFSGDGNELVAAGRQIRAVGEEISRHREETQSRQALVETTEVRARYAKALDEAALSGADTTKLREQMDAELAKIGEKFDTRKGMDALALYTANAGREYDQQANQIAVSRAATQARSEGQKLVNALAAEIDRDPSTLPRQEEKVREFLKSFSGISPEARTKLGDEWAKDLNYKAAVRSMRDAPEASLKRLEDGQWNVTPEQRDVLVGRAKTEINNQRVDRERERQDKERVDREQVDAGRAKFFDLMGQKKTVSWAAIRDEPAFASNSPAAVAAKKELMTMMEARVKAAAGEERQGDRKLANDLWLEINSRQVFNPTVVVDAVREHMQGRPGLDTRQADYLLGQMRSLRDGGDQTYRAVFASEMRRQQAALSDDIMLSATPEGIRAREAIFAAIKGEAEAAAEKRRTSTAKGQDPADLFDPNHKDYFFTKKNIETIKARVVNQEQDAAVKGALEKGAPRVTGIGDPVLRDVKVGALFVDESGNVRKMTADIRKRAMVAATAAAPVPDRERWMQATGGVLAPGQTEADAIAAWKRGR